jgi:hypothetical protein
MLPNACYAAPLTDREPRRSTFWDRAKLVILIVLCIGLAALGGIGMALGILSTTAPR